LGKFINMGMENLHKEPDSIVRGCYLAISIPKEILMDWLQFKYVSMPDQYISTAIKEVQKPPHTTWKYFGDVKKEDLYEIKGLVFDNLDYLKDATIRINGISLIGDKKKNMALVGLVDCSEEIKEFKKLLDEHFSNLSELPFRPHTTIMETHKIDQVRRAQRIVAVLGDFRTVKAKIDHIYLADKKHKPVFTIPE
jgi:2'-5' RNA ligase